MNKIIINDKHKVKINEYTNRYIEVCTLFDSLFSISRVICVKMTKKLNSWKNLLKNTFILEKSTFIYKRY